MRSLRFNKMLLQHVGFAVVASLVLIGAFGAAGMAPRPLWFVATALAVGFGSVALRQLGPQLLETNWPARHDKRSRRRGARATTTGPSSSRPGCRSRAASGATARVRTRSPDGSSRCCWSSPSTGSCTATASIPTLTRSAPGRSIGDQLWDLITADDKRIATLAEIEAAIQTIENL